MTPFSVVTSFATELATPTVADVRKDILPRSSLYMSDVKTGGRRDHEQAKPSGKPHRHRRHRKQQQQHGAVTSSQTGDAPSSAVDADHRNAERHLPVDVTDIASPRSKNNER